MKLTKYGVLIICIVTLSACIVFADEECECGMEIDSSKSAEYHITSYAEMVNSIVPALQVIAHNGAVAPSVEVLHGYAQVIINGLEGSSGPHGNLVPLHKEIPDLDGKVLPPPGSPRSDWIEFFGSEEALSEFEDSPSPTEALLAPLRDDLDIVKLGNPEIRKWGSIIPSSNDYIGLITIKGGALCLIERMLPQLNLYAQEMFADNPGQQLYIEALGNQVQTLLQLAQESAVACIRTTDYDTAAEHMLNVNAYLFTAMGNNLSRVERPVTGTGLVFLMYNLLGWTWFGI